MESEAFYDVTDSRCKECKKAWVALARIAEQRGKKKTLLEWRRENPIQAVALVAFFRQWTGKPCIGRKRKRQPSFDIEAWLARTDA